MIPAFIATNSAAERRLFELLRADPLAKDWVVLHSLGLTNRGRKPYGEIDFVIIIPQRGIVCLEIKGGRISCQNGNWQVIDRQNQVSLLKRSPFMQAREGMFALLNYLKRKQPQLAFISFSFGVVTPDVDLAIESPEVHPWQILDYSKVNQGFAKEILHLITQQQASHPGRRPTPQPRHIEEIIALIRPNFEKLYPDALRANHIDQQISQFTQEQFEALDSMAANPRCLFEGAAGTGKSMLASESAIRESLNGKTTILTCFSPKLAKHFVNQLCNHQTPNLHVISFEALLQDLIAKSPSADSYNKLIHADAITPEILYAFGLKASLEVPPSIEQLIIDEAQDLLTLPVLAILDKILIGGLANGKWQIFGDFSRQALRIIKEDSWFLKQLATYSSHFTKYKLTINCRNTVNIGEETAVMSGFQTLPYKLNNIIGPPVNYLFYNTSEEQDHKLGNLVDDLTKKQLLTATVLLTTNMEECFSITSKFPTLACFTIQEFKGLESSIIILYGITSQVLQSPYLLYTGMSRARSQLYIFQHESARPYYNEKTRAKLQNEHKNDPQ